MGSSFGNRLRVTIFGQSHSEAIGCVMEGLPSGIHIDEDKLQEFMSRRAPGQNAWSTPRRETDRVHIVSGLNKDGRTCGAPLAAFINNTNTRSSDYDELRRVPRPGHADYTAQLKWHGEQDVAGGGHFSARLTAPLCVAGGIALQLLEMRNVQVLAHVAQIGPVRDVPFDALRNTHESKAHLQAQMETLRAARPSAFPTICAKSGTQMAKVIEDARSQGDSVGGVVECVATGFAAGIGEPRYDGIQGTIARIVFGIPAVKGLEFGAGFGVADLKGSQNNDAYGVDKGNIRITSNNAGGSLGGISTGEPVLFRMAVKPTPSIAQPQHSVNLEERRDAILKVRGRHDPCVAPRAVPVAEAAMAVALLDSYLSFPCAAKDWASGPNDQNEHSA